MRKVNLVMAGFFTLALLACGERGNDKKNATLSRTVEGILTIGHEVRCLTIQGDTADYWIIDKTGDLVRQYDSITQGQKNGRPVYAELQVVDAGYPKDGFARNYDRVMEVVGIGSLALNSKDLQSWSENNRDLGNLVEEHYEGVLPAADCPGIGYQLYVRHREHSGDGQFFLQLTYIEADNGKDAIYTYTGRRYTMRGIPADNDATVWQLVSDNGKNVFNFLYGADGQMLTLLNDSFEMPESESDYSLKKVD